MERGYIKIYRKILDSGIIQNPHALQLLCFLLLTASYKTISVDVRGEMIKLEPGQVVFGRQKVAEKLNISEKNVRTALKYLEKNEIVAIRPTKRYTIISIINWHIYQALNIQEGQQSGHEAAMRRPSNGHEAAMRRPSNGHEAATIKEFKNLRIKEFNNISIKENENLSIEELNSLMPEKSGSKESLKILDEKFLNFARRFQNEVKINLGNTAPVITDKLIFSGAAELEKATRIDCLDWEELTRALIWATQDSFWRQNLRSLASLRNKTRNGVTKVQEIVGRYRAEQDGQAKEKGTGRQYNPADRDKYVWEQNKQMVQRWYERELQKQEMQNGQDDE